MKVIKSKKGNTSCDLNIQSKISAQNLTCQMYAITYVQNTYHKQMPTAIWLIVLNKEKIINCSECGKRGKS